MSLRPPVLHALPENPAKCSLSSRCSSHVPLRRPPGLGRGPTGHVFPGVVLWFLLSLSPASPEKQAAGLVTEFVKTKQAAESTGSRLPFYVRYFVQQSTTWVLFSNLTNEESG